jgi:hypothetical protein
VAAPEATTTPAQTDQTPSTVDPNASWTPYVPDPAKTANENLTLKGEHDAKVPEGHDPNVPLAPKPAQPVADPTKPPQADEASLLTLEKLVAPEGFEIDPALGTELVGVINENRADPAALASSLIALQVKASNAASEAASLAWDNVQAEWKKASEVDPEIGGAKYAPNLAASKQVQARFGTPAFEEALALTGFGNHPEYLRFISRMAPHLVEAGPVSPANPTPAGPAYTTTNLYPSLDKK